MDLDEYLCTKMAVVEEMELKKRGTITSVDLNGFLARMRALYPSDERALFNWLLLMDLEIQNY